MDTSKILMFPEYGANNSNGLFGGSGLGGGILGFLLGLFFGNGWGNGFGGFGGGFGGGNGAGFISNQIDNNAGRELLMNAITSQGEASRTAIASLSSMLGQDFNLVNSNVLAILNGLSQLALQQAVSVPQLINSIQAGNTTLMSKLCECCCENRLLTTQQGYESQIRTLELTNQLSQQADRNTQSITGAIAAQTTQMTKEFCDLKERELQNKINTQGEIITQLRNQLSNTAQTAQFAAMLAPINAELAAIKAAQPATITLPNNSMTAVPTIWANAVADNFVDRVASAIAPTTTTPAA